MDEKKKQDLKDVVRECPLLHYYKIINSFSPIVLHNLDLALMKRFTSPDEYQNIRDFIPQESRENLDLAIELELERRKYRPENMAQMIKELGTPIRKPMSDKTRYERHIVTGKRSHRIKLSDEDVEFVVGSMKNRIVKTHEDLLGQRPVYASMKSLAHLRDPTEFINHCISNSLVSSVIAEYFTGMRFNIDFISGVGKTLLTLVSYEFNIATNNESLYIATPGFKYGVDERFLLDWSSSPTQDAALFDYDVENVIDNPYMIKNNVFKKFIPSGRTLSPYEPKDTLDEDMKKVEDFEKMLSGGIERIAASYKPEYKGRYTKGDKTTEQEGWYSTAEFGNLLHKITSERNILSSQYSQKEVELYLKIRVANKIVQNLIENPDYGIKHEHTSKLIRYMQDWAKENPELQKRVDFDVTGELFKLL